jgi:hypothetical protein
MAIPLLMENFFVFVFWIACINGHAYVKISISENACCILLTGHMASYLNQYNIFVLCTTLLRLYAPVVKGTSLEYNIFYYMWIEYDIFYYMWIP